MFRVWGKIMKDNRLVKDTVVCIDDASLARTKKVYKALEEICYEFDLAKPIWLKKKIKMILFSTQEHVSIMIISWKRLNSTIWIFRLLKRIINMFTVNDIGKNYKKRKWY